MESRICLRFEPQPDRLNFTFYDIEAALLNYFANPPLESNKSLPLYQIFQLWAQVPEFDKTLILKYYDHVEASNKKHCYCKANNLPMPDLHSSNIKNLVTDLRDCTHYTILFHIMLALDLYPKEMNKDDVKYLAYHASISHVDKINAISQDIVTTILEGKTLKKSEAVCWDLLEPYLKEYLVDYRLLRQYLDYGYEINGYMFNLMKYLTRVDDQMVDQFIDTLKSDVKNRNQFLALLLFVSNKINNIKLKNVTRFAPLNVLQYYPIVAAISNDCHKRHLNMIMEVTKAEAQEQIEIANFITSYFDSDNTRIKFLLLWSMIPALHELITDTGYRYLMEKDHFIHFFTNKRRNCRHLLMLLLACNMVPVEMRERVPIWVRGPKYVYDIEPVPSNAMELAAVIMCDKEFGANSKLYH